MTIPSAAPVFRLAAVWVLATFAAAASAHVGRPIYSEPGAGIALPPGCSFEPSWRARLTNSDLELWVVECTMQPHVWLVRRGVIEYDRSNRARLRFQVLDERKYPGETAGETVSVQCTGHGGAETGVAVIGATWRPAQGLLRLASAKAALRVDGRNGKLAEIAANQIDCTRFPDREETMRQLQQRDRKKQ
jgi:hypothetical protein